MVDFNPERVTALPENPEKNTAYFVKAPGRATASLYVTGNTTSPAMVGPVPSLEALAGTSSRTAEFDALGVAGGFLLAPGTYSLATSPVLTTAAIMGVGASFTGPAYPSGLADGTVINRAGVWSIKAATDGYANYAHASQMVAYPSGVHNRRFESSGHISTMVVYDNSTYVSDGDITNPGEDLSMRDYVGNSASMLGAGGLNLFHLRLWGANNYVKVGSDITHNDTVDGAFVGSENRIDNWGRDSGEYATATQKYAVLAVAGGNKSLTAGLTFVSGATGANAYYGCAVQDIACKRYAFSLMQLDAGTPQNAKWGILPDGTTEMKATAAPATPGSKRARMYYDTADNTLKVKFPGGGVQGLGNVNGTMSYTGLVTAASDYLGSSIRVTGTCGPATASGGPGLEISAAGGVPNLLGFNRTTSTFLPVTFTGASMNFAFGAGAAKVLVLDNTFGNFANDAAAAAGGVPINSMYRNGSALMVRVA